MDRIIRKIILFTYNIPITTYHYAIPIMVLIIRWGSRIPFGSFVVLFDALPKKLLYLPITMTVSLIVPVLYMLPEYHPDDRIPSNIMIMCMQIINGMIVETIVHRYCRLVPEHCYYGLVERPVSEGGPMRLARGLLQAMVAIYLGIFLWYARSLRGAAAAAARAAARWLWQHARSLLAAVTLILHARQYRLDLPIAFLLILHTAFKATIEEYLSFVLREVPLFTDDDIVIVMIVIERAVVRFHLVERGQRRLVVVAMGDN